MQLIKEKLLSFYINRLLKSSKRARWNVGYQQAKTIGILYTREDPQKEIYILQFIDLLAKTGKKIQALEYIPANLAQQETMHKKIPSFVEHEISFLGKSKNEELTKFMDTCFDYLYHIDLTSNILLDYLLVKCQAKCRIGSFNINRATCFEVMVSFEAKPDTPALKSLTKHLLYYTQLL
jgi:hypothetical protein